MAGFHLWKFSTISGKGGALLAKEEIPVGTIIITEEAAVAGPSNKTTCLECLSPEASDLCEKCHQTFCSICKEEKILSQHDGTECQVLKVVKEMFVNV